MNLGNREPLGVGALIWDETKVSFVVIALHATKLIIAIPCPIDSVLYLTHIYSRFLIIITQSLYNKLF